ncbi:hypothetical protein INS49_003802 [Diaporthe citri]|uniref:uncharacterized protein n=1 Tax=Diaporthe citri TaxID=83186 RepID=UPI001C803433|nr:uncharacterized protein INS49_003802 [Diaporthe citri]KAG6354721.1 hypothetical protein INS49_003802 [Diaporthe citri]
MVAHAAAPLLSPPWEAARPVGFGLGLVLGGVFSDSVGWRWGFHATSILNIVVLAIALWSLPAGVDDDAPLGRATLTRLQKELDWVGALVISTSLAFLSYVLLAVVADSDASVHMRAPLDIVFLVSVFPSSTIALLLPYLKTSYAVPVACFVSGLAPLLLAALCRVNGPSYWQAAFQAMALNPLGADLMYTIAMLVTTEAFPPKTQALWWCLQHGLSDRQECWYRNNGYHSTTGVFTAHGKLRFKRSIASRVSSWLVV